MTVWTIGLNHHTAPVDVRGRFAFALDQIGQRLDHLRNAVSPHLEAAILSTCNRTELYAASHVANPLDAGGHFLADFHKLNYSELRPHLYMLPQHQAVRHTFRVASGLDSMVLGEPQILGQMKDAVRAAEGAGAMGSTLHQLF
eukprot:gene49126-65849_t